MLPEHKQNFYETKSKIIGIDRRREDVIELIFYCPSIAEISRPGQFVMIESPGSFLRRPMSIFNINDKDLHLLIRRSGKGTERFFNCKIGDMIKILGPLGGGFPLPNQSLKPILLAGGLGIAPLYFLYTRLVSSNFWPEFLYGENIGDDTVLANIIPGRARLASMDGKAGYRGYITDVLEALIRSKNDKELIVYACGPEDMYRTMQNMEILNEIPTLISLEERMACGIGACMGCSVMTVDGYKKVCKDGPVFYLNEIRL
ncbi:MAG: dihydroorotate dehydrogenase electron transfer subunit [Candidatus Zixiibacteriota bacterium]